MGTAAGQDLCGSPRLWLRQRQPPGAPIRACGSLTTSRTSRKGNIACGTGLQRSLQQHPLRRHPGHGHARTRRGPPGDESVGADHDQPGRQLQAGRLVCLRPTGRCHDDGFVLRAGAGGPRLGSPERDSALHEAHVHLCGGHRDDDGRRAESDAHDSIFVRVQDRERTTSGRSPAPANKRIQVYYALAGGAKGMAYWWFKSGYPYNGSERLGHRRRRRSGRKSACSGNEIKTAQPLLVTGHPVSVPLTPSANVWARALASGTDTMILFAVNDNYYNDQAGTHLTPVANATRDGHAALLDAAFADRVRDHGGRLEAREHAAQRQPIAAQPRHVEGDQDDRADHATRNCCPPSSSGMTPVSGRASAPSLRRVARTSR